MCISVELILTSYFYFTTVNCRRVKHNTEILHIVC